MIMRGSPKSSHSVLKSSALYKAISKDIDRVLALPLIIESLQSIKNEGVVPLGVAEKFSINKKEERYIKSHVTHDCTFPGPSGLLVNNRFQRDSLLPCFIVSACSGFYT